MANYLDIAIFEAELVIKRKATMTWSQAHTFMDRIWHDKRFNRGFNVEGHDKMILPLNYSDAANAASFPARASLFTPRSQGYTQGFDHAVYEFTRGENSIDIRADERKQIESGKRMAFLPNKAKQMMESFRLGWSGQLAGNANAGFTSLLGLRYLLSTSNSPGGISQSSNAWWRARVTTGVGPWNTQVFADQYDNIGDRGRGSPDMLVLSNASGNNLFGRMRNEVDAPTRVQSTEKKPNVGHVEFTFLEIPCYRDQHLGAAASGTAALLKSDTFYAGGDQEPLLVSDGGQKGERRHGTGSLELFYEWWFCVGCDDPNCNAYFTDIEA